MDDTDEKTKSPVSISNAPKKNKLPPVKELLIASWHLMTQKLIKMIFLNLLFLGLILLFVLAVTLVMLVSGGVSTISGGSAPLPLMIILGLFSVTVYVTSILAYSAGWLLMLDDKDEETSVFTYFKRGLSFVLPLFITGLLMFFLMMGGFLLFLIPGIIISVLILFANYVVIFEGKKWMSAVKISTSMISQNFAAVFGRMILLWLMTVGLQILIQTMLKNAPSVYTGILIFVLSFAAGFYSSAYSYLLYKEAKEAYDNKKTSSVTWMVIVAIAGWVIFGLIIYTIAKSNAVKDLGGMISESIEQELSEVSK